MPVPLAVFTRVDWAIVVLYLMAMVVIGHWVGRKKTDAHGYFLAGRATPMWGVILSTIATTLSAATFIGAPESSYRGNLSYFILNIGGFIAVVVVGVLFIPRFYRAGTITIYGYIQQQMGEEARISCSAMFLVGRALASGARLFVASTPVCLLLFRGNQPTQGQLMAAIVLIGAVGIAYTASGGIKAVIWTDTAQIIIVMGAALLSIYLLLHRIPMSIGQIFHELAKPGTAPDGGNKLKLLDLSTRSTASFTLWTALFANSLINIAAFGVDQDLVQRMLTAKSAWRGSVSLILAQVLGMIVSAMFMIIGLLLYIYYGRPDLMGTATPPPMNIATQQIYPRFLLTLPSGLSGLAMAGLFAAAQGSLDSAINAMASSAVTDLYWPLLRYHGREPDISSRSQSPRIAVVATGAVLIGFACLCVTLFDGGNQTLLEFVLGVMAFAYTGLLGVFLTAMFTSRGSAFSVGLALLVGVMVTTLMQDRIFAAWTTHLLGSTWHVSSIWAMPVGTPICFVICCCGKRSHAVSR